MTSFGNGVFTEVIKSEQVWRDALLPSGTRVLGGGEGLSQETDMGKVHAQWQGHMRSGEEGARWGPQEAPFLPAWVLQMVIQDASLVSAPSLGSSVMWPRQAHTLGSHVPELSESPGQLLEEHHSIWVCLAFSQRWML